jgi:GWxTD domain-containing protein
MFFESRKYTSVLTTLFFLLSLGACSNSYIDQVDKGSNYNYIPGFPELRVASTGYIDENNSAFINIASEIVYGSLLYKKRDSIFIASASISYQILDLDDSNNIIPLKEQEIRLTDRTNKLSFDQSTYKVEENFKVNPGNFKVITTIVDNNTGKQMNRTAEIFIPDPTSSIKHITNIKVLKKEASAEAIYSPVTTYDIQNDIDSLRFVFQITNGNSTEPLTINTRLIKFDSDTSYAKPMNYTNYNSGSIQYKGIDYSESEEINTNRRVITTTGNIFIEFTFPKLERGNYRFEVTSNLDEENELYKARDFSIKSSNYPSLKNPFELAKPLFYLMSKKEYDELMSIEDEVLLKKAIDKFWLSNIQNSQIARGVIQLFYERVEEANKQFSNFKEGWKTDMGMMYILFGPPWFVESSLNRTVWHYSYNTSDPEKNFYFEAPKIQSKFFPFDNYLLERSPNYYSTQYQQIEAWRSGVILKRL